MAAKTLEINAEEATLVALLYDEDTETRELMRTLFRKLVMVNQARVAAGGAL